MRFPNGRHMLGEQGGGYGVACGKSGRPDDEYASENAKRFTVDSLLQVRRPNAVDKRSRPDEVDGTNNTTNCYDNASNTYVLLVM